jgi:hypothetical protein
MADRSVIVQPSKDSVGFDVICADRKTILLERLSSKRAAYCRAGEFVEHKCEVKVLAA